MSRNCFAPACDTNYKSSRNRNKLLGLKNPSLFSAPKFQLDCGGSIINRNFILTAAHCMYERDSETSKIRLRDKSEILVKLGLTYIENDTFAQEFEVKKILIHPKYRPKALDYDIALLQLNRSIEYNAYVRPICLPPKDLLENTPLYRPEEFVWVTGWGHTQYVPLYQYPGEINFSNKLKEITVPIQSVETCKESLKRRSSLFTQRSSLFTERMLCAGDGSGKSTCYGDSGGPLMQPQMDSEGYLYWTQVGIVSWGIGCGVTSTYGFYAHVHKLLPWIEKNIEGGNVQNTETV